MADPRDIVEIGRSRGSRAASAAGAAPPPARGLKRPFLSIWYRCCNVYGRMYRNGEGTAYDGRCPRCGAMTRAAIGPDGTSRRAFEAA